MRLGEVSLGMTLHKRIGKIRHYYWAAKARLYYKFQFGRFGKGSLIYRPMYIEFPELIEIGSGVFIRDGIRLEMVLDPFGRKPRLTIGSGTSIEQSVHIVCHNRISIGSNVAIAAGCAIVDVTHPFRDVRLTSKMGTRFVDEDSFVEIGDGAFIGYGVVILPNVRLGRNAVVGANSVVTKDVPDFGVVAGAPAVLLEQYDPEANEWRNMRPQKKVT